MTHLTDRELEVLRLLCIGKDEHEVADILGLKHSTARAHQYNVRNKLGVEHKHGLCYAALSQGLVTLEQLKGGTK